MSEDPGHDMKDSLTACDKTCQEMEDVANGAERLGVDGLVDVGNGVLAEVAVDLDVPVVS